MNDATPMTLQAEQEAEPAFIPISRTDVITAILKPEHWGDPADRQLAEDVFRKIGCLRQHKSAVMLNELSDVYDPFNPDDETHNQNELTEQERHAQGKIFNDRLRALIASANFTELTEQGLEDVLSNASPDGVHVDVDFSEFEVMLLFYRGEGEEQKSKRDITKLFLKSLNYSVPTYQRLCMAIKFKDENTRIRELMEQHQINEEKARKKLKKLRKMLPSCFSTDHIYLKIFKNIPRYDVEMLFPNIRVKMKYRDKLQLGGNALLGTLTYILGTATKLMVAVALSPVMLAVALLSGFGGIAYAQIRNIFITRDKYRMQLAQSLYFQNLANNQGALALIIDDAEEEDVKEAALLYAHLIAGPVQHSDLEKVRLKINEFLHSQFGLNIQFDLWDALARLTKIGIVRQWPDGTVDAMPLADANRHLTMLWGRELER